jgi:hypothetical protein
LRSDPHLQPLDAIEVRAELSPQIQRSADGRVGEAAGRLWLERQAVKLESRAKPTHCPRRFEVLVQISTREAASDRKIVRFRTWLLGTLKNE